MATPPVVLVVEEHPELRHVLTDALDWEGYEVVPARDDAEAAAVLEDRRIDLLVSDPSPFPGGREALAALEAEYPDVPVVTLADEHDNVIFLGPWYTIGNRRTLSRPFRLGDFIAACRDAVGPAQVERDEPDTEEE